MLGQKVVIQFLSQILLGFLAFASTTLIARFGGPETLGAIGYVFGILGILAAFSDLGYSQAHIKHVSAGKNLDRLNGTMLLVFSVLNGSFFIIALSYLSVSFFYQAPFLIDKKYIPLFFILLLAQTFFYFGQALLLTFEAKQETAKINFVLVVSRLFRLMTTVLVIAFSMGLLAIGSSFLIESLVTLFLAVFFFRKLPIKRTDIKYIKSYTKYALPLMVSVPVTYLNGNVDKLLLNFLSGTREVGYYFAIFGIISMAQMFSGATASVFFPQVVKLAQKKHEQIEDSVGKMVKYLSLIIIPLVVLLIFFSKLIVLTILGNAFLPSVNVLSIFAVSVFILFVSRSYGYILYAIEKHYVMPAVNVLSMILLVILNFYFVPRDFFGFPTLGLGASGAALASVCTMLFNTTTYLYFVWKFTRIKPYFELFLYALFGTATYFFIKLVFNILNFDSLNFFAAIFGSFLVFATFIALMVFSGRLGKKDLTYLLDSFGPRTLIKYIYSEVRK